MTEYDSATDVPEPEEVDWAGPAPETSPVHPPLPSYPEETALPHSVPLEDDPTHEEGPASGQWQTKGRGRNTDEMHMKCKEDADLHGSTLQGGGRK